MNIKNSEILTALKTLGLDSGAVPEEIHAAFRKLARELHPDITGSKSDFRFKQITGAYNILKNLTPEELNVNIPASQTKKNLYDYYNAEKKRKNDEAEVNSILEKYENEIKEHFSTHKNYFDIDINSVILRLKSDKLKVIHAVLKYSGQFANRVEFRRALTEILKRSDIDTDTANIIETLPFDDVTRKLIALDTAENAKNFPTGLIINLIGNDSDVMESFLMNVKPDDVAVILRRWPTGKIMNQNVIRNLLASDDARILVPLLGAIKTHFPTYSKIHKKRLTALENHSSAAVRAWAKKLLS